MPSMDIVSTVDFQALDNAVNSVKREITTRYDFRNIKSEISLDRKGKTIQITSADDLKVKAITDILIAQSVRFKIDAKSFEVGAIDSAALGTAKMTVKIKEGISKDVAQKIVKMIKDLNLKVQPAIQEEQIRVAGKQIDDLQAVMRSLNEKELPVPLQFVNLKR